ncbi:DNA methyltransferase [Anaerococcus lactolyticus]|uniref:site-specific DNA-methyltransferase (adenine-specific) n=1 Tax=Anaerococcus lactolyticus S7-1-13 TaxID=1284686 RepID=A0A095X6P8_9FIRM|nr:DNA methyltransferase [Anaerococcus lactolyticus]KGF05331.1 methylase [Anaerococcus lactolyticus S7-1-13]
MKLVDQQKRAREFAKRWANTGDEKSESQKFWLELLENVLGVEDPYSYIEFESRIKLDNTSFIDGYIEATHVLIEQKSSNKDLKKPIIQSDGTKLSPFQQAKRYSIELPYSQRPRWIITCNFKEFFIYDMEKPNAEAEIIKLEDLENEVYRLNFIVSEEEDFIKRETQISIDAGEIVASLYDALLREYQHPDNEATLHSLNILCVRLVFCLYAEDAGLFGNKNMFHDYLNKYKDSNPRAALINLFRILNQKEEDRDPYEDKDLLAFPYVNGGLFADMDVEIPRLNPNIVDIILNRASLDFDWSKISPTIFGSVFESTLNPETRRSGGMHYTSIKNIHKVIDPLFLDELKEEFEEIKEIDQVKQKRQRIEELHYKIANLKFLDPAAGSGNFLTETYISLRKLENKIIEEKIRQKDVISISFIDGSSEELEDPIRVNLGQFYGIEINDFAVTVARTALWISEDQMMKETMNIIHQTMDILPLKSYANIVEGNALTMDWNDLVDKNELDYIMGNPPFVGGMMMDREQKEQIKSIFGNISGVGEIDYVTAWYKKSAEMMNENPNIVTALVSTNSISQGMQPAIYWKYLRDKYDVDIVFAYSTFKWESEAVMKAAVHVVIIGFTNINNEKKRDKFLYTSDTARKVSYINGYLIEAGDIYIESRNKPICDVKEMNFGNMPRDGGAFILTEEEKDWLIKNEPITKEWIHLYLGAREFINSKKRYCLWLEGVEPNLLRNSASVMKRVESVRDMRLSSKAKSTQKMAETPTLFAQRTQKIGKPFIMVPRVSSENRKYVPIGFLPGDIIASDAALIITDADIYDFGILTSNVHMSWMRAVAGRLEMRYRYSKNIVYNNFPWPVLDDYHKRRIEKSAQMILDARAIYPSSSLADLYDELAMPPELIKAHQENDARVMKAYGFDWENMSESDCVAELMKMYEKLIGK